MAKYNKKRKGSGKSRAERKAEVLKTLAAGIAEVYSSDRWAQYLGLQAKFHSYSFNNTMLILSQCPHAGRVAGFNQWRELDRHVKKGESAIWIFAPAYYKDTEIDKETGAEKETKRLYFITVPVFDVSQTEGQDLASPVGKLTGDDAGLVASLAAFAGGRGIPVKFQDVPGEANGYCTLAKAGPEVYVQDGMAPAMTAKTLAHEIAHALMHTGKDESRAGLSTADLELEAESVAYVVLQHFGIDSGDYSFGYIASWRFEHKDADKALAELGSRIQKTAADIIDGINAGAGTEQVPVRLAA